MKYYILGIPATTIKITTIKIDVSVFPVNLDNKYIKIPIQINWNIYAGNNKLGNNFKGRNMNQDKPEVMEYNPETI